MPWTLIYRAIRRRSASKRGSEARAAHAAVGAAHATLEVDQVGRSLLDRPFQPDEGDHHAAFVNPRLL